MKGIHEVEWNEEKIKSLWKIYETLPEFSEEKFLPLDFYKNLLRYIKKFLKLPARVLDIGCGTGTLVEELYKLGFETYGCNITEESIKKLQEKYRLQNKNIILRHGSIYSLPFESDLFDYVFATEVLEHLLPDSLDTALKEVKRVMMPKGRFIITVPYKEKLSKTVCPECHTVFVPAQHLTSFDEEKMKKILSDAGFKLEFCKLVPKIPLTGNKIKDFTKRFIASINKRAISFMYGSIFITVASKS